MSKNKKNNSKSKKRETKAEKEKREEKELKKLDNELREVSTEIKKVALKNKKIIIDEWENESEGLTSHTQELGLNNQNFSPSLEMVNAPRGRLVPLERTLQISTQSPSILGNDNGNKNEEFNPFKYNSSSGEDPGAPKYTAYESGAGIKKIDVVEQSRNSPELRVHAQEVGFNPMRTPEKKSIENYVPVKGAENVSDFGRKKQERTELKYTPSGS